MANSDDKLDWGTARIEVTALMPEIDQFLLDGHSKTKIYKMLKRQGKIECGFSTFCRWIDRLSSETPKPVVTTVAKIPSKTKPTNKPLKAKETPLPTSKKHKQASSAESSKTLRRTKTVLPEFNLKKGSDDGSN